MNRQRHRNIDSCKITVLSNLEDVKTIRPIWEKMQYSQSSPVPNTDIDRYFSILEPIKDTVKPYIALLQYNDYPEAMIIGRLENHSLRLKLGYKTLFRPKLRCLTIEYGGVLGQPKSDLGSLLIRHLMMELRSREFDMVYFNHLRTDSCIYQLSRKMPSVLNRCYFPKIEPHWTMLVPDNMELFYKSCSPKNRSNLRRLVRRLEREYPGQNKIVTYCREDELDDAIKAASRISAKTYQYAIGAGFVDNLRARTLLSTAAKMGWLRFHILFVDEKPCAFQIALHYGKTYFGDQIGYDPKWRNFRVGTVLFLKLIESFCGDPNVKFFDFGFGDAEYKHSFGDQQWQEASVYIFAPRLYPVSINMLRTFTMGLSLVLECALNKISLTGWVKRRWRNLLQKRNME